MKALLPAGEADTLSGDRHDAGREFTAQAAARLRSSLSGGMPATGVMTRAGAKIRKGHARAWPAGRTRLPCSPSPDSPRRWPGRVPTAVPGAILVLGALRPAVGMP